MNGISKVALAAALIVSATASFADGIKWNTDLATAMKTAKKAHKPVMVDFYGES